jgi:hypothetical protein
MLNLYHKMKIKMVQEVVFELHTVDMPIDIFLMARQQGLAYNNIFLFGYDE